MPVREVFQTDLAAKALSLCSGTGLSVSQFLGKMGGNHAKDIDLVRELEARGLLLSTRERRARGRPQYLLHTSLLGEQFMRDLSRLLDLRLHCNENDIKRAVHQANLALRLVEQQVSPYARFQEVNELARNIAGTT